MPLTAHIKSLNRIVDIDEIPHDGRYLPGDIICQMPDCQDKMFIRAAFSAEVRPHFCHYSGECSTKYGSHPESVEHLEGKRRIQVFLREWYSERGMSPEVNLEVPVDCPPNGRKADVLVTFPSGVSIAHEIQLCRITVDEIAARTASYSSVGVDCCWWIGHGSAADDEQIRSWILRTFGQLRRLLRSQVETTVVPLGRGATSAASRGSGPEHRS